MWKKAQKDKKIKLLFQESLMTLNFVSTSVLTSSNGGYSEEITNNNESIKNNRDNSSNKTLYQQLLE